MELTKKQLMEMPWLEYSRCPFCDRLLGASEGGRRAFCDIHGYMEWEDIPKLHEQSVPVRLSRLEEAINKLSEKIDGLTGT